MSEPIPTGCESVDELLGGGFDRGAVTQVYGPPAAGKTNLALAAAVEAAATGGTALYIDTEGLSVDRLEQLSRARVREDGGLREGGGLAADATGRADGGAGGADGEAGGANGEAGGTDGGVADTADADRSVAADGAPTVDEAVQDLASRIIITEAYDFDDQAEAVRDAEEFADRVDLVVLDSATGFYRLARDDEDGGAALRDVARQVTHLLSLARKHDLAVVITNQVYADPESESERPRPLGGHTLTHWSGVVLRVERFRAGNRRATLEKHRSKPAGDTARFRIVEDGLESVDEGAPGGI